MNGRVRARDNPFATWRLHEIRFRAPTFHWDDFEFRWSRLYFRAAIVGPHGSGKTQLLEEVAQRLENQGHSVQRLRLHANQRWQNWKLCRLFVSTLTPTDYVLLDGAEQLNPLLWSMVKARTKQCQGLLITTHRAGRLPTVLQCSVSISLLDELLKELLGNEAETWLAPAHQLFEKHQGNLRDVFRALYDKYAQTQSARSIASIAEKIG